MPQTIGNIIYTISVIKIIENIFMITPRATISCIFKYHEPKTTAFGGVATGSMNAQEAATAAPTISPKG